ncbi:FHA domain-containing protein [Frankia sp. CNm7]|uniref:FHA domain-containing protein n=1 Tax=Frankia nepalensis TaxID=1836974 RepID=A0A937RK12_9ACTN|nr:FHA domain-containing protein [Frankia nepalensis]MBL7501275.1 FHA domain-containing protein [Frankia nepalensis]MBL7510122.1 FHA domain-containing protein [Frankia nepalensis]MBL7523861.1 FHA domain-containing protein [Frankia nepalensis]MBL7627356.1 FHA domain-containing protein [Frankia nepalensis]
MEAQLVRSAKDADYIVDLSNVAREKSFGGPGDRNLRRLRLVLDALADLTGDPAVRVYLVADRSLLGEERKFTGRADARRLRGWVSGSLVEEVGDADERILELAAITGIPVITGDFYVGYRDEHGWIQGDTSRFLKPVPVDPGDPEGTAVRLEARDMGVRPAHDISARKEQDAFKARGLLDHRRRPRLDVLSRAWRCPDQRCTLYDLREAGGRVLLPRMRRGVPTCDLHRAPLLDDGPRPGAAQLKVVVAGRVVERHTLSEGSETAIGRHPEPGIGLYGLLDPDVAARVSRAHVVVSLRTETVLVRDVSSFGTRMRLARRDFRLGDWTALVPGVDYRFHPGDEVELTDGVVLTRSGQIFPNETADAWAHASPKRGESPVDARAATIRA